MSTSILTAEHIENRKPVQLENVTAASPTVRASKAAAGTQVWFNTRGFQTLADRDGLMLRLPSFSYTGALLHPENVATLIAGLPSGLLAAILVQKEEDLAPALLAAGARAPITIVSSDARVLGLAAERGLETALYQYVDDGASLHRAIHLGKGYAFLMICFRDPTNIPLELVIASLQSTRTVLIKEIQNPDDVDDAVVSLGVMEVGADGVMYSPQKHELLEAFGRKLHASRSEQLGLEPATVTRSEPIGMGYRSCIDLATLFDPKEGMIVGSTSQGGILCCPEVYFLPYMETRPFRVNAGGVHSYVYNAEGRTNYMSELSAGSSVLIVGMDGKTRKAPVGRMKTELRPLRLIEARFAGGETINVILQDDWHVRVFSTEGLPLNITELKAGSVVMAHKARPGRHVGIKIDENIIET
jgi:3-dehydroquinate synthase II/3-amino-4-hydroxybenzoic acid synthase